MWWHGHAGSWGGWWALVWVCWMLLVWGGLAALAVALVRRWRRWRPPSVSPEDILAERYARGEIDTEEYQQRLSVLRNQKQ